METTLKETPRMFCLQTSQSYNTLIQIGDTTFFKKTFKQRLNPQYNKTLLDHPNIVKVIEDTPEYQVQEYIEGDTLFNTVPQLSFEELKSIFYQIRDALDYLHQNKIIHCDVSPFNIIVQQNQKQIKAFLIDLDRSVVLGNKSDNSSIFAAPEQKKGGFVCAGTDVWGFAMTMLWSLLRKQHSSQMSISLLLSPITQHHYQRIFGQKANRRLGLAKLEEEFILKSEISSGQSQVSTLLHSDLECDELDW